MLDALKLLASLINLPEGRLRSSLAWAGQSMFTTLLIAMLFAGQYMIRERSVIDGFKMAFVNSSADIAQKRQAVEIAELQAELQTAAVVNHVVEVEMAKILKINPPPARVRMTILHNGIVNLAGWPLLHADITNAVAAPGRATGGLSVNLPIQSVASFSAELFDGNCFTRNVTDLEHTPGREHLDSFGAYRFLSCPLAYEGQMMGIVTVYWDKNDTIPTSDQEKLATEALRAVADKISAALTLRRRSSSVGLKVALDKTP